MNLFTNREKYDMLECFILCRRNIDAAGEMYFQKYPERRQPGRSIFPRIRENLINHGSFIKVKRNRNRNENNENLVLQAVIENPRTSLREIESNVGVARSTSHTILKRFKYHPYHERPTQGLQQGDHGRRTEFCQWFIQKCTEYPDFTRNILWSDESRFTNCGLFNRKNTHYWSDENPYLYRETRHQVKWGFNVWIGIIDSHIVGPFFFHENLTSVFYLNMFQTQIGDRIMELPLATVRNMIFQHDGAPAHNAHIVTNFLNAEYPNGWIGNQGPIRWPARGPDLSPIDFFVWGYLKNKVYSISYNNEEELRQAVIEAVNDITPDMIRNTCDAVLTRWRYCIQENGGLFEHLLH